MNLSDPGGCKREKMRSPLILVKMVPIQIARHNISSDENVSSNRVWMEKIWSVKVVVNKFKVNLMTLPSI